MKKINSLISIFLFLCLLMSPSIFAHQTTEPNFKDDHHYKAVFINWTPNSSVKSSFMWWLMEGLAGRGYLHSSLLILEYKDKNAAVKIELDDNGEIHFPDSQRVHYLSYPDGNRLSAYWNHGSKKRPIIFEAIEIEKNLSKQSLEDYYHVIKHNRYLFGHFWQSKDTQRLDSQKRSVVKSLLKKDFYALNSQLMNLAKTSPINCWSESLYSLAIKEVGLDESEHTSNKDILIEYMARQFNYYKYRESFDFLYNTCIHAVDKGLQALLKEEHQLHFSKNRASLLSPQPYARAIIKAYPNSRLHRLSSTSDDVYEMESISQMTPMGARGYFFIYTKYLLKSFLHIVKASKSNSL